MDATAASPSFGGRNSASDDLAERGCLVCGLLVVIESDLGAFTTPPVLSMHETSSESMNSINSNPGHMVSLSYLVVLPLGDRSRQQRARGRLRSHRPPCFFFFENDNPRDPPIPATGTGRRTHSLSGGFPSPTNFLHSTEDGRCKRNV